MGATRTQAVTHDVGDRISFTLRPVISIKLENWDVGPPQIYLQTRQSGFLAGVFLQDEISLAIADALMVNLARQHGWGFGIFSPENQPIEDHMARVIEKYAGLPFSDGPTQRMSKTELEAGIQ